MVRLLFLMLSYFGGVLAGINEVEQKEHRRQLSDEENLLNELFSKYNPSARPVLNSSNTVSVSVQFSLMHIKELDVKSQIFTTTGLLILEWTDERLTWDPQDHNGMTEIMVEAGGLWRPEFAVINGAEKIYEDYNQFRAAITHAGLVHWEPGVQENIERAMESKGRQRIRCQADKLNLQSHNPFPDISGVFKTMCGIDITYYPFDEQKCVLLFGAWSYHTSKMNLTNSKDIINLDSYSENGEWDIFGTPVERNEFAYDCCPNERFSNVAFYVYLRRRHMFYILNVILPSIMTSILLLSIFFCTPGQKVQIGVVVLLSFRIFLLNVSDSIPKTSDYIPLLGIYLTCTMAITTLSMVLTIFVLNLHHISDRPVPPWVKTTVMIYLARMLGMCGSEKIDQEDYKEDHHKDQTIGVKNGSMCKTYSSISQENTYDIEEPPIVEKGSPWVRRESFQILDSSSTTSKDNNFYSWEQSKARLQAIEKKLTPKRTVTANKDIIVDYAKDWKRIAEIFDRLFFWLFLLAIVVTTMVLFQPLTKAYFQQFTILH